MDFIGSITAEPDPPGINKDRWVNVIGEHPALALFERREGINPFTKKWMVVQPRPDRVRVLVGGREVGMMRWSRPGANEVHVFGDVEEVGPIAREVAGLLGAWFDSDATQARSTSGRLVEKVWRSISIYDGPEAFLQQFHAIRPEVGHLFAAQWCNSEVCNGGFHQFFTNSTGVLAPEALDGFRAIGLHELAGLLEEAMRFFGEPYPRDREERQAKLAAIPGETRQDRDPFYGLDPQFFQWLRIERGRFERIMDDYARSIPA